MIYNIYFCLLVYLIGQTIGDQQRANANWRDFRRSHWTDYDDQAPVHQQLRRQYHKRNAGRDDFYGRYSGPIDGQSSGGGNGGGGGDGQNGNGPQSQSEFGE